MNLNLLNHPEKRISRVLIAITWLLACGTLAPGATSGEPVIGRFNTEKDMLLLHYDCKTDVDDIESAAAAGTILRDQRFKGVRYHAVAGTYGTQGGLYVPANDFFARVFGMRWSDAHNAYEAALNDVSRLAIGAMKDGGAVWIAEGGQSDFSADVLRRVKAALPDADTGQCFHIVQHSDWNEEVTSAEDLAYVKANAAYHRIPDGNAPGNGTPCFRTESSAGLDEIQKEELTAIWKEAVAISNRFNGTSDRYLNEAIKSGGLDFSDTVEVCWIFGYSSLADAPEFFREFGR